MQIKPQTVEAVLFFNDGGVCKEMLYPEFEAMLDGVVSMPEFADQQMRVAYVLVNARLQIRAAVFFYLDFNEDGSADSGWNLPLRNLAERSGRGPDLGAGPIRLACRSQCPVSWYQMHLWDPELAQGTNHFVMLRDRIKRNQLGLLVEEDLPQAVPTERLQMVAEDTWYAADPVKPPLDSPRAEQAEQDQRRKAAQLIKQQRLRIASLEQQREADICRLRELADERQAKLSEEIVQLRNELADREQRLAALQKELDDQVEKFQSNREEMRRQLRALEESSRADAETMRARFDEDVSRQITAAVAEYKEQISIRDVELAYRNELDTELQDEIEQLKKQRDALIEQSGDRVLERLSALGMAFMVYHPGAGHLTIPLQDMARYQQSPLAYAASKCGVPQDQYDLWLQHYLQPMCVAKLPSGERCGMPLDRVESPGRFVIGESNCCARHRSQDRLRTGS